MTGTAAGLALVALGGGIGSALRVALTWSVASRVSGESTVAATLAANVLGSFVLGLVVPLTDSAAGARLLLAAGLCGGFTTFSTLSWEAVTAFEDGRPWFALGYALVSFTTGAGALWGGLALGRAIAR